MSEKDFFKKLAAFNGKFMVYKGTRKAPLAHGHILTCCGQKHDAIEVVDSVVEDLHGPKPQRWIARVIMASFTEHYPATRQKLLKVLGLKDK